MLGLNEVVSYFKEVASSLKFQVAAAITFGAALLLVWLKEDNELKIVLTVLFLFPTCMFVGSIVERIVGFFKRKKERKFEKFKGKLGLLGEHQYTDKLTELWKDNDFEGLGWQIFVNTATNSAYLTHPSCYSCKTDLVVRTNSSSDGFYLECNDCKKIHNVDDIGEKRSIANSSFQGEVRRNPSKYFNWF